MNINYSFKFQDGRVIDFRVATESPKVSSADLMPAWTRLEHCQCTNCPLKKGDVEFCPAATEILPVVEVFKAEDAYQKVDVTVTDKRRTYFKQTTLEESLRSLLGLKMATSGCPVLSELKPMALDHLPFATNDEFIMRSVGYYLLQQMFAMRNQEEPDWALAGLVQRNQKLQLVNQALWQRIHAVCKGDSNLKALLNFFSMASSVSVSLESQLRKLQARMKGES
ncbi:DUF6901 family protein [Marinobacter sp.]|uniref:DUF6901 family protein n=1 Tax=Marinobacter sp. TaxID=50741 RepID=UPI0035636A02